MDKESMVQGEEPRMWCWFRQITRGAGAEEKQDLLGFDAKNSSLKWMENLHLIIENEKSL